METKNLLISDEQTNKIASYIYLDIAIYIKEHKDEYIKWLKIKEETNE